MGSLNRAAMRRAQKEKAKDEATKKTHDKYNEGYENGFEDGYLAGMTYGVTETVRVCTTAFMGTVKKEYQLGKVRFERLLIDVLATFNYYKGNKGTEAKQRKWIKDNMGIDLDQYTGCGSLDTMREYVPKTHTKDQFERKFRSTRDYQKSIAAEAVFGEYHKRASSVE